MKVMVDRHVITPAGAPPSEFGMSPTDDGHVVMQVRAEGVRVTVIMTPDEAQSSVGIGAVACGHEARKIAFMKQQQQAGPPKPNGGILQG